MSKIKKDLKHIHKSQLSDGIQVDMDKNGFSIYKGVLVVWDKVPDKKVINLIDTVVGKYPDQLLVVHFENNLLEMIWKDVLPPEFERHVISETKAGRIEMEPSVYVIPVIFN